MRAWRRSLGSGPAALRVWLSALINEIRWQRVAQTKSVYAPTLFGFDTGLLTT